MFLYLLTFEQPRLTAIGIGTGEEEVEIDFIESRHGHGSLDQVI